MIEELDSPDTPFAFEVRVSVIVSAKLPAVAVFAVTERLALLPAVILETVPREILELVFEPLTAKLS